jgi:hypothetical protein
MAPFTRGQATKATATEVTALAAYSASEIGRQARERDSAIAQAAQTYVVMLATLMDDDDFVVRLGGKSTVVKPDDLRGDFSFFAQDSGSTPMSEAVKKQEFTTLIPMLQQLGVSNETILKTLVRAYDLPEDFLPEQAPPGFALLRPLIHKGWEMVLMVAELSRPDLDLPALQAHYAQALQPALQRWGWQPEPLQRALEQVRAAAIAADRAAWLALLAEQGLSIPTA